jgi:RNA polymerase sigma-54 factor
MAFFLISFYIIYMASIEQRRHQSTVQTQHQKIADELGKRGYKIARRTVAKYRAKLNIGSSFER